MRVIFVLLMMISAHAFAGCDSIADSDQKATVAATRSSTGIYVLNAML
ncbi:hypothetical protein SAMN04490208_5220 [Pseudomonas poae]|uniref:Uncharacterized protein n=1 Tax=Pseudomonas poae TaxID=200451 RepID=A0ABY0S6I6_9PSED|nr:hypothetical protein SAMN04490208_5220 [Pseudomonas poae]